MPKRKNILTSDLIIAMSKYGDELGHPPTTAEVHQRAKDGKMASVNIYLSRLGYNEKIGKNTWGIVLAACGMQMPENRPGRGRKLSSAEKARRNRIAMDKKKQRENLAREKRIAEFKAKKAKEEKAQPHKITPPVPQPIAVSITGRQGLADELELINLIGMPVVVVKHKKPMILQPNGSVIFYAESYKFLDDVTISKELSELFGNVQARRVHMPFCIVTTSNERIAFPPPKPGTYYLLPRQQAEIIASTGRTMNDLVFPLQYRKAKNLLEIQTIGIKISKK